MKIKTKTKQQVLRLDIEKLEKNVEVPVLRYPLLEESQMVEHLFTTRQGGVSQGIFSSLNLSFSRGDEPEAVGENYRRIAEIFGTTPDRIVCSDQTHTTNVRLVTARDGGNGVTREKDFYDTDGMITQEPGLVLATFYADCVPLYFVDPRTRSIGLSHSGWRGTVGRMGQKTIEKMTEEFGSRPEELLCAIGPSICQDCYEVSEDVADAFAREFPEQVPEILLDKKNGKYQLNLWKANEIILREAGILPEHLATTNICTCCNKELLFSHRGSQGKRGNLGAFLMIREK